MQLSLLDSPRKGLGRFDPCQRLRMSGRMWLRAQSCGGRQDYQQHPRARCCSASFGHRSTRRVIILLVVLHIISVVDSFVVVQKFDRVRMWKMVQIDGGEEEMDAEEFGDDWDTGGAQLEDLNWRVEKLRLEEQNTRRFLKSKPRFLPYEDCRQWVQAWGRRWRNQDDWENWIAMGEKRNAYIPSQPDEYYGRLGKWISWEHFLGVATAEDDDLEDELF